MHRSVEYSLTPATSAHICNKLISTLQHRQS